MFSGGDRVNLENHKLKLVSLACVLGLLGLVGAGVYAYTSWTQNISWTYTAASSSFSISNLQTLNYGNLIGNTIKTETYTVTNDGNVPITITASAIPTGSATVAWDQVQATVAPSATATFTLTLTITGQGSCAVEFNGA